MLQDARELAAAGEDVVVGWVETHGRYETAALLLGLEILPRRRVDYRGGELEEFDLDAALARKPGILLLDELAHTNAPGGRHAKRWQDVEELLDAGIDVYTTLNIQHVESLNDVVAQITGVRVRETVPDAILERADEVELVDLPPEELLERLREGKVYLRRAGRARRAQLLPARQPARAARARAAPHRRARRRGRAGLPRASTASRRPGRRPSASSSASGASPASARLVRAARRMAAGLRAPWVAACVERPETRRCSREDRERLDENLRLAETLGAQRRAAGGRAPERGDPVVRARAQRHAHRGRQADALALARPAARLAARRDGARQRDIDVHVILGDEAPCALRARAARARAARLGRLGRGRRAGRRGHRHRGGGLAADRAARRRDALPAR